MNWVNSENKTFWAALLYVLCSVLVVVYDLEPLWFYFFALIGISLAIYLITFDMLASISNGYFAHRVLFRISISAVLFVVSSTLFFSAYGLYHSVPDNSGPKTFDSLYYSIVSFSTLGYGDLASQGYIGRLVSALLAVAGNFHLALIAGASFSLITQTKP